MPSFRDRVIYPDSSHKTQGGYNFLFDINLNDKKFAALRATGFGDLATISGAVDFSLIEPNDVPLGK